MPDAFESRRPAGGARGMRKMHSKMVERHRPTHKQPGGARSPFPRAETVDPSGVRKRRRGE